MLLLADTPGPFRDVVERFIAKRTLVVRCTTEPAELLRSLRQDSIALLLIDVVAIGLSPLEEAEVRRLAAARGVPILTLTTRPPAGADVLLKSRFSLAELWTQIERLSREPSSDG